jgi:hypothetical protein
MRIVIVGDLFCGGDLLQEKPSPDLVQIPEFHQADFRIANLENPLSDCPYTADKSAIHAPTSAVEYLKAFKIDGVSLANNHIQDKGEAGIIDTFNTLKRASILYCGAGETLAKARKPMVLTDVNGRVAVLGYCDFARPHLQQVYLATDKSPGVAPLRYETIVEDLKDLPGDTDRVILFFHWGREHTWFPPQHDIKVARQLLAHPKVALIVGSHSHLPQGCIDYNGKKAFMGLGNFLFPNYFIKPPTQIDYPDSATDYEVTLGYHQVHRLTHKRWPKWSRRALMVSYNTTDGMCSVTFAEQDYLNPVVRKANPFRRFYILSRVYNKGGFFYRFLSDSWYKYVKLKRRLLIYQTYIKNHGLIYSVRKGIAKVFGKIHTV